MEGSNVLTEAACPITVRAVAELPLAVRPRAARDKAASVTKPSEAAPSLSKAAVDVALAGDTAALRALVVAITPVVQARVARTVLRRRPRSGADLRTFMEDLVQDTFVALLHEQGKLLRSWNPERGLKLESFVALVAEQRVLAILRSRRRSPFTEELAVDDADLDHADSESKTPEAHLLSREALQNLLDEVRSRLSPMGLELFMALVVREESIASVCARTQLSTAAVQAWSSRLKRLVNALAATPIGAVPAGTEAP